jgi:hypothetical protein
MKHFILSIFFIAALSCSKDDSDDSVVVDDSTTPTDSLLTSDSTSAIDSISTIDSILTIDSISTIDSIVDIDSIITDDDSTSTDLLYTLWDGPVLLFTKEPNKDPSEASNQDAITASVSITRGNDGGEIYNFIIENVYTKGTSPKGTKWAIGELSDVANLSFSTFRTAVDKPREAVGKNLVLFIEEEKIYLSVVFKSWGNKDGSFSYERSTKKN